MSSAYQRSYQLRPHRRDEFIEFIKALLLTPFVVQTRQAFHTEQIVSAAYGEILTSVSQLVQDHIKHRQSGLVSTSALQDMVRSVGGFFTPLDLREAFDTYDRRTHLSARRFVPPSFNDIRVILNIAQVQAIRTQLKLITFDGDQTLYEDGANFHRDSPLIGDIIELLLRGIHVALVTAAGYKGAPGKYEQRLEGLLAELSHRNLPAKVLSRFFVVGGECNYLFQCRKGPSADGHLHCGLHEVDWSTSWDPASLTTLLDAAAASLEDAVARMQLPFRIMRKPHAVGTIRIDKTKPVSREQLDELVLSVKHALDKAGVALPYCAFNGGSDVWVDVGNKLLGIQTLQKHLGATESETLHIGDQFSIDGNDVAARECCCTVWVSDPRETGSALRILLYGSEDGAPGAA